MDDIIANAKRKFSEAEDFVVEEIRGQTFWEDNENISRYPTPPVVVKEITKADAILEGEFGKQLLDSDEEIFTPGEAPWHSGVEDDLEELLRLVLSQSSGMENHLIYCHLDP